MKIIKILKLAIFPILLATYTSSFAATLPEVLTKVTPSIVNIIVERMNPLQPFQLNKSGSQKSVDVGSGVIINAQKGYIVTNAHVVQNEKEIIVTLKNGQRYFARLVGKDDGYDIAVIAIQAQGLTALPFGNSDDLKVGEQVAAIGSPFDLNQTVTTGVISALNRDHPKMENYQNFIQTDAPINPGNSGGALVNMQGQLVGINTAIYTPVDANIGIGFAIPSNMVQGVVKQLIRYGKVRHGMLGVVAQDLTPDLAQALGLTQNEAHGTLVNKILQGSAAANAGIHVQDVIEKVDGQQIRSAEQLRNILGIIPPGTKITLSIIRNHQPMTINAIVGDPKANLTQRVLPFLNGLALEKLNILLGDGQILQGALVTHVSDTSPGFLAGLTPGDIITEANGHAVTSLQELENIALSGPKNLLLKVERDNMALYVVIMRNEG